MAPASVYRRPSVRYLTGARTGQKMKKKTYFPCIVWPDAMLLSVIFLISMLAASARYTDMQGLISEQTGMKLRN